MNRYIDEESKYSHEKLHLFDSFLPALTDSYHGYDVYEKLFLPTLPTQEISRQKLNISAPRQCIY